MVALKAIDVKNNFKEICSKIINGEIIMLSRPRNQNVVMLSESEYNELAKAKRNLDYLTKLENSINETKVRFAAEKTLEELRAMEK
jgi:antitoxin YefM